MKNEWLNKAVFYEIYPTSFYDGSGDGTGDIEGIIQKMPYVKELGCDGIWFNPFFKSEFKDGGYDITDFYAVDPRFGTYGDVVEMCKTAKKLGLKLLFDLVPGHTSDKHPWFLESQKSGRNKYSDYYIWTDHVFVWDAGYLKGMSERSGGYAVNFFAMQPSLNYGFVNPTKSWQIDYKDPRLSPLREEVINIIKFWLKTGCDGFRIDMAWSLVKDDADGQATKWVWQQIFSEVRKEYPDALFIPETGVPQNTLPGGWNMDFSLPWEDTHKLMLRCEKGDAYYDYKYDKYGYNYFASHGKGSAEEFVKKYPEWLKCAAENDGYIAYITGNHDVTRVSFNRDETDLKIYFAFLLTLPCVPFIYYGDEIGMKHLNIPTKDGGYCRTGSRTPMLWGGGANKGFSAAPKEKLYLPLDESGETVAEQKKRKDSLLNTVKSLTALRKKHGITADAKMEIISAENNGYPFVYGATNSSGTIVTAVNPAAKPASADLAGAYKILDCLNCSFVKGKITFNDKGYIILEKLK